MHYYKAKHLKEVEKKYTENLNDYIFFFFFILELYFKTLFLNIIIHYSHFTIVTE